QTNVGTITIHLNWDKAPISSQNFLNYINSGFYKDTFFHRIYTVADPKDSTKTLIKVVQGGGFDAKTMQLKTPSASIVNEASNGLHNSIGTISMARTAEPNSATSQFFFNVTDNSSSFDAVAADASTGIAANVGYAVFGTVTGGMDIVNKIGNYNTIKTAYSEGVPFIDVTDCGFNFCLKKVIIDAVYASNVVDTINSVTRVSVKGNGKVTSMPSSFSCTSGSKSCTLKKPFGTDVSLWAKPFTGYEFKGWSGDCQGTTMPLALNTKTSNNNCTATFTKIGA
ncbi:MAG: peptidylprolyl isomerase, partial [Methylococcales bacterium]|nr:peptidylprolyl isomerase [Methylococcales bacterium]